MIQYIPKKEEKILKNDKKLLKGYKFIEQLNYCPAWLIDRVIDKETPIAKNERIVKYYENRTEYLGTVKGNMWIAEYYKKDNQIIGFLSNFYQNSYNLVAVSIFENEEIIQ